MRTAKATSSVYLIGTSPDAHNLGSILYAARGPVSTGIGFAAHFKCVEPAPFDFGRYAVSDGVLSHTEKHPRQSKYHHEVHHDANQLHGKLAGVTIEQTA